MVEAEIIDFMLSLNRGHAAPVKVNIAARIVCGGKTRIFQTTASNFELYRAGKINDLAILKGLK
jgi:hypothetical protein